MRLTLTHLAGKIALQMDVNAHLDVESTARSLNRTRVANSNRKCAAVTIIVCTFERIGRMHRASNRKLNG